MEKEPHTTPSEENPTKPERAPQQEMSPAEILEKADGRTIVLGEVYTDREARDASLALIQEAHEKGYKVLGVEVSEDGFEGYGGLPGLKDDLKYLQELGLETPLDEYDPKSCVPPVDEEGNRPRINRYWQMQEALRLGWDIVSIDPNHWNWTQQTAEGYTTSREPQMMEEIEKHENMVAIVGIGHCMAIANELEEGITTAGLTSADNIPSFETVSDDAVRMDYFAELPLVRQPEQSSE